MAAISSLIIIPTPLLPGPMPLGEPTYLYFGKFEIQLKDSWTSVSYRNRTSKLYSSKRAYISIIFALAPFIFQVPMANPFL